MAEGPIVAKHTFLVIRCSSVPHCVNLFHELKRLNPPQSSRWIWIIQPGAIASFEDAWRECDVERRPYDRGAFDFRSLKDLFLARLRREKIEAAYVPFNNPDGRGYGDIIRFLAVARVDRIYAHWPNGRFEEMTPFKYARMRVSDETASFIAGLALLIMIPFIILYYFILSLWLRRRPKLNAA